MCFQQILSFGHKFIVPIATSDFNIPKLLADLKPIIQFYNNSGRNIALNSAICLTIPFIRLIEINISQPIFSLESARS